MNEEEFENRLSQLEEEVYGQTDNSKLDKKIGKLQTKFRELKEEQEDVNSELSEQKRILERVKEEEEILEEVQSLKRKIERKAESEKEEIQNISDDNLQKLEDYMEQAEKLEENIERAVDAHEELLDRFDGKVSEVHQEIAVAMEKADISLNLQSFSLVETYIPQEYREEVSRMLGECYRLPYDRTATFTALIATWVSLCEGELRQYYDEDPTMSPEVFEAFLVDRRLDHETDGIWSNVHKHMRDDQDVEEFIDSSAGQKIQENIWDVLGEPNIELIEHDVDSHILRIHRGISDEKRQEAVDWFRNHYELQDRTEAVSELVERYFEEAEV